MKPITVQVEDDVYKELTMLRLDLDLPMQALIRQWIDEKLQEHNAGQGNIKKGLPLCLTCGRPINHGNDTTPYCSHSCMPEQVPFKEGRVISKRGYTGYASYGLHNRRYCMLCGAPTHELTTITEVLEGKVRYICWGCTIIPNYDYSTPPPSMTPEELLEYVKKGGEL